jgi:hypothetical protein
MVRMTCCDPEAHEAHMQMNGECPWCGAGDGFAIRKPADWDFQDADTVDTSVEEDIDQDWADKNGVDVKNELYLVEMYGIMGEASES